MCTKILSQKIIEGSGRSVLSRAQSNSVHVIAVWLLITISGVTFGGQAEDIFADYDFVSVQIDYRIKSEHVTKLISPSGDKYDSFYWVKIIHKSGLPVSPEIRMPGHAVIHEESGSRMMAVSFDCDYTKGQTEGALTFEYEHPGNAYKKVNVTINTTCTPQTDEQVQEQLAKEREAKVARIAKQQRQATLDREREQQHTEEESRKAVAAAREAEYERAEQEYKQSAEYKREQAIKVIRMTRTQIDDARKAMNQERRVGEISGYVDKRRLHDLGAMILFLEDELELYWRTYKENGGQASQLKDVK